MAYFDNAATTYPKPVEVYDFMDKFYRESGANAGRGNYGIAQGAGRLIGETRELIKDLLHCPAKQVVFTPTATVALNIILQGLVDLGLKHVYISPFEHNAVTRTLHAFEIKGDIHLYELTVNAKLQYDLERIKYQFDNNKPDLVVVSHASNVIGLVAPVEDIFALAKEYDSFTVADMSQSAGLVDCNVGLSTFDFAVFAGHKTLYGPTGISGFVMNPEIKLPSVLYGGTGTESANQDMPESIPERFEMGTLNISGIAGLNAALKWNNDIGLDEISRKENENRNKLISILEGYDWLKIVGNVPGNHYVGIVSCLISGISSDSAGTIFNEQGIAVRTGLQCAPLAHRFLSTFPAGTIRFSVGYFTCDKDFEELKSALDFIEGEM
ncbi:aminotransferase class V-fold PLP-dependent enzyme [Enterocloster clostridioformis]|uniref:aminotransferase class V-fold PLP-dependent enzyme n=1 Tax=Enterocloster clostridioformis TaxID=1531 RepID=UPI0018AA873A|nr:aminotransferase class V-fold PLP-dependent enzyme [Enterocloster clostridioformis]MDB2127503.1 aminotransferase class V-fold PLP-dependent enzyme [Enterocloster clostridioformis]